MTIYTAVLYLHVLATLVLFGVLSIESLMLRQLRQAATIADARPWLNPAPGLRIAAIGSLLFLFLSGGYLADRISAWNLAWPKLTVVAIVLFGALGAISGNRQRAIRTTASYRANYSELATRLYDPILPGSLGIRIGLGLGVILLMTAKPGMLESLVILAVSIVLGLAATLLLLRKPAALAAGSTAQTQGD